MKILDIVSNLLVILCMADLIQLRYQIYKNGVAK